MQETAFRDLLIKTSFACMVCDGDIDKNEENTIRAVFIDYNIEEILNRYVLELNDKGKLFFSEYIDELGKEEFSEEEELEIIKTAFETIYADFDIKYSEIKFVKLIRSKLRVSTQTVLSTFPCKEVFLEKSFNAIKLRLPEIDQLLEKDIHTSQDDQKLRDDYFNTAHLPILNQFIKEDTKGNSHNG